MPGPMRPHATPCGPIHRGFPLGPLALLRPGTQLPYFADVSFRSSNDSNFQLQSHARPSTSFRPQPPLRPEKVPGHTATPGAFLLAPNPQAYCQAVNAPHKAAPQHLHGVLAVIIGALRPCPFGAERPPLALVGAEWRRRGHQSEAPGGARSASEERRVCSHLAHVIGAHESKDICAALAYRVDMSCPTLPPHTAPGAGFKVWWLGSKCTQRIT